MLKGLLIALLFFSSALNCQSINGQLITDINPPVYSVTIAINLQDSIGTARVLQIEFTYDSKALDFPVSPIKNVDYLLHGDFELYTTQNVTKPNDNTIRISLLALGTPPPVLIDTSLTMIITLYLTITNPQGTSDLVWTQTNVSPGFLQQNYQVGNWPNLNEPLSNVTGLNNNTESIDYFLFQNYPNPFNPATKIRFSLPKETRLKINIYIMLGELVETIAEGTYEVGYHKVAFNATSAVGGLPSGLYIYRIESSEYVQTSKMLLLK
ncbi:MAG: T9SS type A sorting domain-containing protein [Ignavibacteriales bacterium]|nr:T9SS C-terminal target domain-containing protein [Ignavibacteriota bacterium]MCZ2270212.1 T9SS type A sorting domain-containing protein [Ignavibacteriales bacterium]HOJ06652.1 T9SS type A sorting domain-containing protein [Ignavibacteriaceae bacterium]